MLGEQAGVALLQLIACPGVIQVDERAVETSLRRSQDVLLAPARSHRVGREIVKGVLAEGIGEGADRAQLGAEVGQDLAQRSPRVLGAVDRPKAPTEIVEAVVPRAELTPREGKRVVPVPHSPQLSLAHSSKLTSCLAAARTSANCAGSTAARRTSTGASSSRRVLVPKSQAFAVFSSKASTIMRTTL